jgi:hypothetical protein
LTRRRWSRGRDLAGEDRPLHLLDVALVALHDGRVVVDDLVQDRPQHRRGPDLEQLRMLLQTQPRPVELARDALPHGDHERRPDEDADLAELDLLARVVVPRGPEDHEGHVLLVVLDLRPEVVDLRVLDGQLVQAEPDADLLQIGIGFEEPSRTNPH